ncbi:ribonuclease III [Thermodesulforhabdus norvegica]|uniref:Ribonuclease 3 n=1 Tax=Thermodesulforhabdus norvegica TaxID=39841 RepID=A0A1I4S6Q7_9BACT|nr:ribonuclease III [Thermodesulforhabdus norvegica]SFM59974.1 RNAse III [Thermodesulforhabdus norvegica]
MSTRRELEEILGYNFKNPELLEQALTHRSYAYEHNLDPKNSDNERLEFLGDAVLGLAMSHLLWHRYPHYSEGELSRLRSAVVNETELAHIARKLNVGRFLLLGKGEENTGGREKPSILADAVEAVLGAIYLDGGWESVLKVVEEHFVPLLEAFSAEDPLAEIDKDYKTKLQEWAQAQFKKTPVYRLDREEGPDHDKTFYVSVLIDTEVVGRGRGRSKKEAQQRAAQVAYKRLVQSAEASIGGNK